MPPYAVREHCSTRQACACGPEYLGEPARMRDRGSYLRAVFVCRAMPLNIAVWAPICEFGKISFEEYPPFMNANLRKLSLDERIRLVEDLWDSIAADQSLLPLTPEQQTELDCRLNAYESDGNAGRLAEEVIADIRKGL